MEYVEAVRRHWLVALLMVLAVMVPTLLVNVLAPGQYTATTRMWVGVAGGDGVTDLNQKVSVAADLMSTYPEVVSSPLVLDPVIAQLGLGEDAATLGSRVVATVPNETMVLEVTVTDESSQRAAAIANAVAAQFGVVVGGLPQLSTSRSAVVEATVIQAALPPASPSEPQLLRNLGIALVLSLALAVITCLVVERYRHDGTPRTGGGATDAVPEWH